jgi:hypothetical protein
MSSDPLVDLLQRTCTYAAHIKYVGGRENVKTWGEIIRSDSSHFVELMCYHVGKESRTFELLFNELPESDRQKSLDSIRERDRPDNVEARKEKFLSYTCEHKSRFNGKTWGYILKNAYSYFLWSVANTMGRETATFAVLVSCLQPEDQQKVLDTPKGEYNYKKRRPKLLQVST